MEHGKRRPPKKIDETRKFSKEEVRLTKESMVRLSSSGYSGQINKNFYHYMSGIVGMTTTFSLMKIYVIATLITSKHCY